MESFPIVAGGGRGLWGLTFLIGLIFISVIVLFIVTSRGSRQSRFVLSENGLAIHGDLYGQLIRRQYLRGNAARIVDLDVDTSLAPKRKSMGTAVPGYRAGWFRLRNGREALLYLTDRHRAVYVPTTAGYDLLLSPQNPERFVQRLKEIAPAD